MTTQSYFNQPIKQPRKSQYKNAIVCPKCDAEYTPNTRWAKVYDEVKHKVNNTCNSEYVLLDYVIDGHCPRCNNYNGFKQD